MGKRRAVSHEEIVERALWIAADIMEEMGMELKPYSGPASAGQIRNFLTGRARRELLRARREASRGYW